MDRESAIKFRWDGQDVQTSAVSYPADSPRALFILAHGAGAPQGHPWMVAMARALAARGVSAMTFNFLYREQRRRFPDPRELLEETWRAAIAHARGLGGPLARLPLFIGGKSMGGRIATQVAALDPGNALKLDGLILFGYPLHPPDKPKQLRVEHLPGLRARSLFLQGERDEFGSPAELAPFLKGLPATLVPVPGADHSLSPPKRKSSPPLDQALAPLADEALRFIESKG